MTKLLYNFAEEFAHNPIYVCGHEEHIVRQHLFPLLSAKWDNEVSLRGNKVISSSQIPSWIRHFGCFDFSKT